MRKILLFLISLFIGIGLFIWVTQTVGWEKIFLSFSVFSSWKGLSILGLTVLMTIIGVWRWKEILKSLGYNIPTRSLFRPYLAGYSISYLAPMIMFGGEMFRGYVTKEKFNIPWFKSMASVIIDRILEWTIYLLVIFAGSTFLFLKIGLPPKNLVIILGGAFIFFTAGIGFFYFKNFKKESIARVFTRIFNQKSLRTEPLEIEKEFFKFFKPKKSFFWKALAISFLKGIIALSRVWLLILFLGETVGMFSALSILGFVYLALLIPVPATLGTHEAVQTFTFNALGLGGLGAGVAFTMIIRGAELIVSLIGIVVLFRLGLKLLETAMLKKAERLANNSQ